MVNSVATAGQVSGGQGTGLDGAGRSHPVEIQYGDFGETNSETREICSGTNKHKHPEISQKLDSL